AKKGCRTWAQGRRWGFTDTSSSSFNRRLLLAFLISPHRGPTLIPADSPIISTWACRWPPFILTLRGNRSTGGVEEFSGGGGQPPPPPPPPYL
ncbi:unnamed protein product, partial [Ilex paraguariensis]